MKKFKMTNKQLKQMIDEGIAVDISSYDGDDISALIKKESLKSIGYTEANDGSWAGNLYYSMNSGRLYAIVGRCNALFYMGF